MIVDCLMDYIGKMSDIRICSESETLSVIQHTFKIVGTGTEKSDIHYLWSKGFNMPSFLASNRFRHLKEDNCRIFLGDILRNDKYYLIIDECCLQGMERPLCLHSKTANLITTISEFNWELYEIYIVDTTFKWLVAFNHVSEVMLYGDASNSECIKIKEYLKHKFIWL